MKVETSLEAETLDSSFRHLKLMDVARCHFAPGALWEFRDTSPL
jgi:hypothetical protein